MVCPRQLCTTKSAEVIEHKDSRAGQTNVSVYFLTVMKVSVVTLTGLKDKVNSRNRQAMETLWTVKYYLLKCESVKPKPTMFFMKGQEMETIMDLEPLNIGNICTDQHKNPCKSGKKIVQMDAKTNYRS